MDSKTAAVGAAFLLTGAASFYAGWLVAESKLNKLYNEQMEREIERTKNVYMASTKPGSPADVAEALGIEFAMGVSDQEAVDHAATSLRKFAAKDVTIVRDGVIVEGPSETLEEMEDEEDEKLEEALVEQNLFEAGEEAIDTTGRTPDKPYQISTLEFMENETEYDMVSVTWYAGDNILTDDNDVLVDDHRFIGQHNLELFGTGKDPNVIHVRNDRLKADYEVTRHTGKFAHVVQGFAHSDVTYERTRRTRRSADE